MKQEIIPTISMPRFPRLFSMPSLFEDENWLMPNESISGLSMSEDEKSIYVEAALPGIDSKDVAVTFDKGVLWIRGQAKEEEEDKKRQYYRTVIPDTVDEVTEPKVIDKNGMIKVTFQKIAKSEPKKLTVKTE